MIKAVLFDVAGVLTEGYTRFIVESAMQTGADLHALGSALLPVFAGDDDTESVGHQLERGEVTLEEFHASLGELEDDARAVLHPASEHFFGHRLEPEPTMHAFVAELVDAGYLTGVVSNNVRAWQDTWDRALPPAELFSAVVFSATVGVRKPSRDIYLMAVERLGVAPHEALFLDDFAPMAEGARAAGLHALHVEAHDVAIGEARALLDG